MKRLVIWLGCFMFGHEWRVAGEGVVGSCTAGQEYSRCILCDADTRKTWEIEDDTQCRLERLHRKVTK